LLFLWIATALKMPRNDGKMRKYLAMTTGKKGGRVVGNGLPRQWKKARNDNREERGNDRLSSLRGAK